MLYCSPEQLDIVKPWKVRFVELEKEIPAVFNPFSQTILTLPLDSPVMATCDMLTMFVSFPLVRLYLPAGKYTCVESRTICRQSRALFRVEQMNMRGNGDPISTFLQHWLLSLVSSTCMVFMGQWRVEESSEVAVVQPRPHDSISDTAVSNRCSIIVGASWALKIINGHVM